MTSAEVSAFVGRADELKIIQQAIEATDKSTYIFLVSGPSGIGKTRLLQEIPNLCHGLNNVVVADQIDAARRVTRNTLWGNDFLVDEAIDRAVVHSQTLRQTPCREKAFNLLHASHLLARQIPFPCQSNLHHTLDRDMGRTCRMKSFSRQLCCHLFIITPLFPQISYPSDHFFVTADILLLVYWRERGVV